MFAQFALSATGRVFGYTGAVTNADTLAAQAYLMDSACVTTASVAASDTYNGGFRYTTDGALRIYDATAGVPAGANTNQGVKLTSNGQLCITTNAISTDKASLNGVSVDSAGRVFMTLLTPAAWFRYGQSITSVAGAVSQWADVSGNNNHLKQATGTNQPALQSDGSILFDGVDNFMQTDAFTLNKPQTVYMLGKQLAWTDTDGIWDGRTADAVMLLEQRTTTPGVRLNASGTSALNSDWPLNTYAVVAAVYNDASSSLQINNGIPVTGTLGSNAGGFTLGKRQGQLFFANIQDKETIVFPVAHASETRAHIITYLSRAL